jgi:hypothetical protein
MVKEVKKLTEQLITIETARLAKEKGLNEGGITWLFYEENGRMFNNEYENGSQDYICCTQDFLHAWLRKNHNMYLEIYIGHDEDSIWWNTEIFSIEKGYVIEPLNEEDINGGSYEEAYENGLQEALKMIK